MKIKLGVLFGGKSTEHEISIISAIQAIDYINKEKYDVVPIYISKNNEFYIGPNIGDISSYTKLDALLKESVRVVPVYDSNKVNLIRYPQKKFSNNIMDHIDIAFPIVHGTNVEDGTLQGFLSMLNIPYVGCDVLSSAVGMDKYVMKTVLKDNNIPVLDCLTFTGSDFDDDPDKIIAKIEEKIGYPVIIKPVNLGSSIGISKAKNQSELYDSLDTAFSYASVILAERAIENLKEINCSVVGDKDKAEASECEEPLGSGDILDFSQKYIGDSSAKGAKGTKGGTKGGSKGMVSLKRKIPADITAEQKGLIQRYAVEAFKCLGCSGVSRIDFMIDQSTGEIFLNEINTIPGSLSFYLWEPVGLKYADLLDKIIELALKRYRLQQNTLYTFDSNVLEGVKLSNGTKGAKGTKR